MTANTSLVEVAKSPTPTLGNIGKDKPGTELALVGLLVARVAMFFAVDWNEQQCALCTQSILKNFDGLTVSEFKVFVERCETGVYKSPKNLTPALLMEWLFEFVREVRHARSEAKNVYEPPVNPAPIELVEKVFGEITAALKADRDDDKPKHSFPSLEDTIEKIKTNSRNAFLADGWTEDEIDDYVTNGIFPERFKK